MKTNNGIHLKNSILVLMIITNTPIFDNLKIDIISPIIRAMNMEIIDIYTVIQSPLAIQVQ